MPKQKTKKTVKQAEGSTTSSVTPVPASTSAETVDKPRKTSTAKFADSGW